MTAYRRHPTPEQYSGKVGLVELQTDPEHVKDMLRVDHTGTTEAETVVLTAGTARKVVDSVINMGWQIHAQTARQEGGKIIIGGVLREERWTIAVRPPASSMARSWRDALSALPSSHALTVFFQIFSATFLERKSLLPLTR